MAPPVANIKYFSDHIEHREAAFSPCDQYRYYLKIVWDDKKSLCNFIGLNPSTATEQKDDPTIRKCKGFARRWGFGGIIMTNIFAIRATDPRVMKKHASPIGELNNQYLRAIAKKCTRQVAAWGNHAAHKNRGAFVADMLRWDDHELVCLGVTKSQEPAHPLYIPYTAALWTFPK